MYNVVLEYAIPGRLEMIKEETLSVLQISFDLHHSYNLFRE